MSSRKAALSAAVSIPPLGLRCSVLKKGIDGNYFEVDPGAAFHPGDSIRLTVEPNVSGYLYILERESSGVWSSLFPSGAVAGASHRVEGRTTYIIPSSGAFQIDEETGRKKLVLLFCREPERDLEMLLSLSGLSPIDSLLYRIRKELVTRRLVVGKVDELTPGDKKEKAVYVVDSSGGAASRVMVELTLSHP